MITLYHLWDWYGKGKQERTNKNTGSNKGTMRKPRLPSQEPRDHRVLVARNILTDSLTLSKSQQWHCHVAKGKLKLNIVTQTSCNRNQMKLLPQLLVIHHLNAVACQHERKKNIRMFCVCWMSLHGDSSMDYVSILIQFYFSCTLSIGCFSINSLNLLIVTGFPACLTTWREL